MIRSLVLSLVAIFGFLSTSVHAETSAPGWVKVATLTVDPRQGGTKTIDLPDVAFRQLRFTADKPVTISAVKTSSGGAFKASRGSFSARPGTPSASFHITNDPVGLKQIEISWNADPAATGPVKLEVWALTGQAPNQVHDQIKANKAAEGKAALEAAEAKAALEAAEARRAAAEAGRRKTMGTSGGSRDGTYSAPFPSPPTPPMPATRAAPSTRSLGAGPPSPASPPSPTTEQPSPPKTRAITVEKPSPPPAPPVASAPSEPSSSAGKPADKSLPPVVASADAKSTACVDANICTVVDVFFGTNRKQTPGPERISFGGDRVSSLGLGHSFVTVPKTNRARGSILRPWQETYLGLTVQGDPALHFTIPKNGVKVYASEADFITAAKAHIANAGDFKDHAFIYVHGFAVTFENALYRAAQISYDLSTDGRPFGTAFVFTWPSKGSVLPTAYAYDQDSADGAADHLRQFINLVTEKTGVANVHIIAHSMGNRVLMSTLEKISLSGSKTRINQIILAAPDVDKQQFETVARGIGLLAKGVTLYASQTDSALVLSRRLRGGAPRAGEVFNPPGPAIVDGIDTVDISAISTSIFDFGHDKYADSPELLADIAKIFVKGDHPPSKRNAQFKLLSQGNLQYWRYAK